MRQRACDVSLRRVTSGNMQLKRVLRSAPRCTFPSFQGNLGIRSSAISNTFPRLHLGFPFLSPFAFSMNQSDRDDSRDQFKPERDSQPASVGAGTAKPQALKRKHDEASAAPEGTQKGGNRQPPRKSSDAGAGATEAAGGATGDSAQQGGLPESVIEEGRLFMLYR